MVETPRRLFHSPAERYPGEQGSKHVHICQCELPVSGTRQSGIQENKDRNTNGGFQGGILSSSGRAVSRRTRIETCSSSRREQKRVSRQSGIQENKDRNI